MADPAKKTSRKRTTKKSTRSSTSTAKAARSRDGDRFPDRIFAIASPRSLGGVSMFEPGVVASAETVGNFASDTAVIERAVNLLRDAGFEVLQASSTMINIAGSRTLYESAFDTELYAEERPTLKDQGIEDTATYFDCTDNDVSGLIDTGGTRFAEVLEGVAIEEPCYLAAPSAFPPPVPYWKLDVPADISLACNADKAHRRGVTGKGVTVAMVDTGQQEHPFFSDRGYRVEPTTLGPGTSDPTVDGHGHGTGESANVFATAPDVTLLPVKAALNSGALVNMTAAFNTAVDLEPDIITNSWGSSVPSGPLSAADQARAAAVSAAVASGIVVVFSAGNGHWGFPGQHPDVISVGGVDVQPDGSLRASDYASGFMSNVYPDRRVPDLSGVVGMRPHAMNIMLPVPPGGVIDQSRPGGSHPTGDETAADDGWAAFSGTSASCPQVAGVCALIKQACPSLSSAAIRDILMSTAVDVTTGTNHPNFGNAATVGPDTATGNGLVDAHRAVLVAKLRCLRIPGLPTRPLVPFAPAQPVQPPLAPINPPLQPVAPLAPPLRPLTPLQPFRQPGRLGPEPQAATLSDEDIAALEQMIIDGDDPTSR